MRILKTVQSYFPFQDSGGPVVKVRALARGLAERGHHVTVLTADLGIGRQDGFEVKIERSRWGWRAAGEGVETIYLSTIGHYRALTLNPHILRFSSVSLKQFDLIHVYGLYDLLGPVVTHFCRRWGIPYVVEPMGMYQPIIRSLWVKRIYHHLLGSKLVRGAHLLIATSEQERHELLDSGLKASRIVVRRNGIDVPSSLPVRGDIRRRLGIPPNAKLILFLGRLVAKKSPELLINAFSRWRAIADPGTPTFLVVAGPEEEAAYLRGLKELCKNLNIEGLVRFTGPLYGEEKWAAYRDADVFVLPSQNENFGNTAAESAACGTPVIVTDQCGIAPIVGGRAGIVVPHSVEALEKALEALLSNPRLCEAFRDGCAAVTRELSWDEPIAQMENLYAQCTGEAVAR